MKIFFGSFAFIIAFSLYFWLTDEPGSGLGWVTAFFVAVPTLVALHNTVKNGSPMNDSTTR